MVINHNISALNTYNQLTKNEKATSSSLQKLSSGLRINSAADDAAGLAISQKMTAQINGLDQASSNAQNGISLVQTADGALNETQSILQRMRTLAVQSSTDTNTDSDRASMQTEVSQLKSEIDRIANTTQFNSKTLLNGDIEGAKVNQATIDTSLKLTSFARLTGDAAMAATDLSADNGKDFTINGVTVTIAGLSATTHAATDNAAAIVNSINNTTGIGVTASADGTGKISLVSKTAAKDITVTAGTAALADIGMGTNNTASSAVTGSTLLTDLANNNGVSLGLQANDSISLSAKVGGTTAQSTSYTVLAASTVANLNTALTTGAITAASISDGSLQITGNAANGTNGALTDVTLSASNRATFNGQFAVFEETQAAQNQHSDNSLTLQIGANQGQSMSVGIDKIDTTSLSLTGIDLSTRQGAQVAVSAIDNAIKLVNNQRSNLGAYQNRLDHTINNLSVESQNLTSASSAITDVDMAKEMMSYTKNNILNQAAQAMLAQANQLPQGILQLLK